MGNNNTSAASRHLAVASAGILALSLVTAAPQSNGSRSEVRSVHLAAFARSPATHPAALLENSISTQARTVVFPNPAVRIAPADTTTAATSTSLTFASVTDRAINRVVTDPAINRLKVSAAAVAAQLPAFNWNQWANQYLLPIVGPFILVGAFVIGIATVAVITIYNQIAKVLRLPTYGAYATTAEATVTTTAVVTTAKRGQADATPDIEAVGTGVSPMATSNKEKVVSTRRVTKTAEVEDISTGSVADTAPEPSVSASTSESAKTSARPAISRSSMRGSAGALKQPREPGPRWHAIHPSTRIRSAGNVAAGSASSATSPAASHSTGSSSSDGDTPGGDADGS